MDVALAFSAVVSATNFQEHVFHLTNSHVRLVISNLLIVSPTREEGQQAQIFPFLSHMQLESRDGEVGESGGHIFI